MEKALIDANLIVCRGIAQRLGLRVSGQEFPREDTHSPRM